MHDGLYLTAVVVTVIVAGCLGGALSDTSSKTPLSFAEVSNKSDFVYNATDTGIGNGNDSVYSADYDNDLNTDILAIGGNEPTLFHNTGKKFEVSGTLPTVSGNIQSALFFDYDNDGWVDLLLLRRSDAPIFLENRKGTFHQTNVGLDSMHTNPVSASAADYNGDGCPDLFVAQYGRWENRTPTGWQVNESITSDNGNPNILYKGTCGRFERTGKDTIAGNHWSLATSFTDFNGDGQADIHVANDYYNDTIYYNTGNGTFNRTILGSKTDRNGMSSEIADINGDNLLDIFITNIYFPNNRDIISEEKQQLFKNFLAHQLGKYGGGNNVLLGTSNNSDFNYAGQRLGVNHGGWGWAATVTDFDNDGRLDVFHSTETIITFNNSNPRFPTPMMWSRTNNNSFSRVDSNDIGFEKTNGRGLSQLDFDRSGTADIALATYDDRYRLYQNNNSVGNSLQVRVKSGDLNYTSIGARVTVVNKDRQLQVNNVKSDYQSQDTRFLHFGLGETASVSKLQVVWPDGTEQVFKNISTDQRIVVTPSGIVANASYRQQINQ